MRTGELPEFKTSNLESARSADCPVDAEGLLHSMTDPLGVVKRPGSFELCENNKNTTRNAIAPTIMIHVMLMNRFTCIYMVPGCGFGAQPRKRDVLNYKILFARKSTPGVTAQRFVQSMNVRR